MYRPRIIPVLLLKDDSLVKSVKFKKHRYIGDPINAVRIFNSFKADELVLLDINATSQKRLISLDLIHLVGEEANMPFSVGGGIQSIEDIRQILKAGAEKVILNTIAGENPDFIKQASNEFGSSTIVVCIDIKKGFMGHTNAWTHSGTKQTKLHYIDFAKKMEDLGAGELIIQSIEKDGTMSGYDISMIKKIAEVVSIPITALGGAGNLIHLSELYQNIFINGLAAGSLFVYHGERKAILVNYPNKEEILNIFIK